MKLKTTFLLLIFLSFIPKALATDYYTASASATLAGNTGAVNANWTTNPDGVTGLTMVAITATDNLIILSGGLVTINVPGSTMSVNNLALNSGAKIIHANSGTANTFNINGTFAWNGIVKALQSSPASNFFKANGNITGNTAVYDNTSTRGVYIGVTGKTIALTQSLSQICVADGLTSTSMLDANNALGLLMNGNTTLGGDCTLYTPLVFNNPAILDLNGKNLKTTAIKLGNLASKVIKGHAASNLTIAGTTTGTNQATIITFSAVAGEAVLNQLNIDSSFDITATGNIFITGNPTVNSLRFGSATTGDNKTRILNVTGNFTVNNNINVRAKGNTAGTLYDQLSVTGNITIGSSATLKIDFTNSYGPSANDVFNFGIYTGTITGNFGTIQTPTGYTASVSYPTGKVQYQVLTAPPPTPQCSYTPNPDLPLVASNATVEAEIDTIVQRFSDSYLGTSEPTTTALNSAIASYNALGITVNGYNITATVNVTDYDQVSFLKTFAQYLKFHPEDTNNIYTKALNTVWLVSDRVCKGTLTPDFNQYSYKNFAQPAILIPGIKNNSYVKSLFENVLNQQDDFRYFWESSYVGGINIDHIGNSGVVTMAYVKWIDSADERFRYMTAFKRLMENFTSYTPGTYDGIKPDGSVFHHQASYPSYTYDLGYAASIIYDLSGTSFEISTAGYLRYREAIMAQLMFTNDATTRFLTMTGRKPEEVTTTISRYDFRTLALAGGSILGTGKSDPVMATFYNRVWGPTNGYTTQFGNSTVASFNEGYFQFNHSMAGIYRKNGWLAVCKGFNDNMFGAEIFGPSDGTANRYGRYQSYGAVQIIYPGDAVTGNGFDYTTWNWNYNPGTTVIQLPWDKLAAEKERVDELQQKKFVGSLSFINKNGNYLKEIQGTYGMFAMDFQEKTGQGWKTVYSGENHNATFVFKKSVFTFDNMLICLGSNIANNDATNNTLTTLYQRKATTGKEDVNVDSNLLQGSSYDNSYADTNNHWIVDNFSTGFYVLSGSGTIKLTRADQQTPQGNKLLPEQTITNNPTGNYTIGYIDHGTAPSNKGYEYVCIPNATATDMTTLDSQITAGNKPYTVHRKDDIAHIVEYKPTTTANSIFGYAFFSALSGINNSGQLTGADYPCLVMSQYDSTQKNLKIAVNNPDIGFEYRANTPSVTKQINITIKGTNWQISQPNTRASITGTANGETTIQFTVVDGLPVEITLNHVLTPQAITFDAIPTKKATDSTFDLTATASSGLEVTYTSSNTAVATISGSTLTIVGEGTSDITASQQGDDMYAVAIPVAKTLKINALPTITVTSPVNNIVVGAPASITITTDAVDTDGTISKVEFFEGMTKLGEASTAPFSFDWANVAAGTYAITAKAIDNDGAVTTSQIINVKVNALPTIAITSPVNSAVIASPATVTIAVGTTDSDGTISKVEFFEGTTKLGEASTAPFGFDWANVPAGIYAITAKATDNDGAVTTSGVINIKVDALPTIAITSPLNSAVIASPATVTIAVGTTDTDGTISKVEFFEGMTKLGEASTAPFGFDWANVPAGTYAITAKATDNDGAVTTSGVINIKVDALPTIAITSPVNNAVIVAPAIVTIDATAADSDGNIIKVEFFQGSTKMGEDLTAPYSFKWDAVTAGTYALTVKATDNNNAVTTSDIININVITNQIPTVTITSPTDNAKFTAPATIHITVNAIDSDGTISKVEFFQGATRLGEALAVPFSFDWTNVAAGTYAIKAKATDNEGAVITSQVVNFTVSSNLSVGGFKGEKNGSNEINFYPNPVKDILNIAINELQPGIIFRLYDVNGKLVKSQIIDQNIQAISLTELASGVYFGHVENANQVVIKKIIKK